MTIARSTPDVGALNPELLKELGISQTVRVGNLVHFSGIVAARGDFVGQESVAVGDMAGQIRFILEVLGKLLVKQGMTFANLVSVTTFTTDLTEFQKCCGLMADAFKAHPPVAAWIEVKGLASPDYLLEVFVIAAD